MPFLLTNIIKELRSEFKYPKPDKFYQVTGWIDPGMNEESDHFCDYFVPFCCSDVSYILKYDFLSMFTITLICKWKCWQRHICVYYVRCITMLKWVRLFVDVLSWRRCENCRFVMSTCPTKLRQNWRMHVNALTSWMLRWLAWSHRWRWCSCRYIGVCLKLSMCHLSFKGYLAVLELKRTKNCMYTQKPYVWEYLYYYY